MVKINYDLAFIFLSLFLIRFYWPGLHAWFKGENSFLEQIQVIMLFCRWVFSLLATIFFLVAMEEISWGQKLFELPTPEFIAKHNTQQEFNLHNNKAIFPKVYLVYLCISGFAAFAWLLRHQIEKLVKKLKQCWLNLLVVPGYLFGYFLPSFIYVILRFNRESKFYKTYLEGQLFEGFNIIHEYEEYTEFLLILGLLIFFSSLYKTITEKKSIKTYSI